MNRNGGNIYARLGRLESDSALRTTGIAAWRKLCRRSSKSSTREYRFCRTLVLFDAAIRAIGADFFWSVSLLHRTRGDKCSHRRVRALELRSIVRRRLEQSPDWETLRLRKRPETFLAFPSPAPD